MRFFFEIHQGLPREGPGDFDSTRRALALLGGLPERPRILDIGCGPGMQTNLELKYCDEPEKLGYLEVENAEIVFYRKYSDLYGYVFYVMRAD